MNNFKELGLRSEIELAITEKGFETPTEIQAKAIPLLIADDIDLVGQAQTGTGKTAAFALPLLQKLLEVDNSSRSIMALVLAPTRELACQIEKEIREFSKHTKGIIPQLVYGGVSIEGQIRNIKKKKPNIIIGTPGRTLDLLDRGVLKLNDAQYAILDEADEMLNMGFIDDVMEILSEFNDDKKTWLFSATMPKPILKLVKEHLTDPEVVKIEKKTMTNEDVEQLYSIVFREHKFEALKRYFDFQDDYYAIVFCQTKIESKTLADEFISNGLKADCLHGDMSQDQRSLAMKRFKAKKINILVCTDVAARGIDIDCLTHVVNLGAPQDNEAYVHRIGRTGRAGNKGVALTILQPNEVFRVKQIEKLTNTSLKLFKIPSGNEIVKSLIDKSIDSVLEEQVGESELVDSIVGELLASTSMEDLIYKFVSRLQRDISKKYRNSSDINVKPRESRDRKGSDRRGGARGNRGRARTRDGEIRFFMNVGKQDGLNVKGLLDNISDNSGINKNNIQNIVLRDRFSFFNVPVNKEKQILGIKNLKIKNRSVKFEVSNS